MDELMTSEDAKKRIDKIVEVTQPAISPPDR